MTGWMKAITSFFLLGFIVNACAFVPVVPLKTPASSYSYRERRGDVCMMYENKKLVAAICRRDAILIAGVVGVVGLSSKWVKAEENGTVGDLFAPTPQELEQARIKAKLKRQSEPLSQQAGSSDDKTYGESLKREREKQKALKKDAQKRREDLCEKLGRGC